MRRRNQVESEPVSQSWQVEQVMFSDFSDEITGLVESCKLSIDHLEDGEIWLIVKDGERVVGCISIETRSDLVHIQSLSVAKDMRKRGIARALVENIYTNFVVPGQTLIAMTLFWNNKTYQALGFEHMPSMIKISDDVASREKHKFCTVWGKRK